MKENHYLIIKLISCFIIISLIITIVTVVTIGSHNASGGSVVTVRTKTNVDDYHQVNKLNVMKKVENTTRFIRIEEESSSKEKIINNNKDDGEIQRVDFIIPYKLPPEFEPYEDLIKQTKHRFYHNTNNSNNNNNNNNNNINNNNQSNSNYDSGHFRIKINNTLWDPHPQYRFHAFGKLFHLVLSLNLNNHHNNHQFISSSNTINNNPNNNNNPNPNPNPNYNNNPNNILMTIHEGNMTWKQNNINEFKCLYNGYIKNDNYSNVAVSLCHGMTGHIRTSNGSYFIQPVEEWKGPLIPILHSITSISSISSSSSNQTFINNDDFSHHHHHSSIPSSKLKTNSQSLLLQSPPLQSLPIIPEINGNREETTSRSHRRKKRSMSTEHYVELMIVTDSTMSAYHGENLKHYVLTLISIVSLVYKDASIGNPINIELVKFHILKDTDFTSSWNRFNNNTNQSNHGLGSSASEMLRNFCKWQKEYNDPDENSLLHHDTALLLTRETICRNPWLHKCDTLGLAELGTMCDHYASCAIVQDNGLSAAFTIAHELGHVMNMPHEDDKKCIPLKTGLNAHTHYVMSRMLDHNTYPWAWSKCSRHFLTEFLDAGHGYCLEDTPITTNLLDGEQYNEAVGRTGNNNRMLQPGEIFSQNKQCQLVFGEASKLCSYMPVCRRLWCTTGEGGGEEEGCRTQHMPWADGTPCAKNKWCQRGSCVLRDLSKLKVVDGGWGEWGTYGPCSRTCGGGIQRSMRECDTPLPSNGGKYCIGPRIRYESCNINECSRTHFDFRTEQCKKFNLDNFNIQGLPKDVQWVAKYAGILGKDRCRLYCRVIGSSAYYLLNEKVIDGTPCGLDTFDLCVNGACLPAGCDKILYSNKELDMCGVCGGNSSTCKTEGGSYNETKYGYNTVVRIPAGASSLDVRQRGLNDSARDDNYLALLDPVKHEYILNGNFIVSMFKRTIDSNGIILEYSGSDSTVERINCSRPLKHDLIVQVLSVGKLYQPDIRFQYVINSFNNSGNIKNSLINNNININNHNNNGNHHNTEQILVINSDYKWNCNLDCTNICVNSLDEQVDDVYCLDINKSNSPCYCPYEWKCKNCNNVCYNTTLYSMAVVHDYYCRHKSQIRCTECSYDWKYSDWGQCSTLCGQGVQIRTVHCIHKNSIVSPGYCERESNRENIEQECTNGPCGKWIIHDWSPVSYFTPCSKTCGPGVSRGLYACHQQNVGGSLLPSHYCSTEEKPLVERECHGPPCFTWKATLWSKCICKNGDDRHPEYQKRRIYCSNYQNHEEVDNSYCAGIPHKFKNTQNCTECIQVQPNARRRKHNKNTSMENLVLNLSNDPSKNYKWVSVKQCNSNEIDSNQDALCVNSIGIAVDSYYCQHFPKPININNCTDFIYNTTTTGGGGNNIITDINNTMKWIWSIESEWTQCTTSCGGGIKTRSIHCKLQTNGVTNHHNNKKQENDSSCDLKIKPEDKQHCNIQPCPSIDNNVVINHHSTNNNIKRKYKWVYGVWTKQCRGECGKGKRYRPVQCVLNKPNEQIPLDENLCKGMKKPRNEKLCFKTKATCSYNWIPSQWSECSKKCGYGLEERTVNCHHINSNGWIDPDPLQNIQFCEQMQKPKDYRYCLRSDCTSIYEWKVEEWSRCHHRCIKNTNVPRKPEKQKRKVYCGRKSDGLKVRNVFCTHLKPEKKRNCINPHTPKFCDADHPATCLQILKNNNNNNNNNIPNQHHQHQDGEYSLQIGGARIQIYCYGMNSSQPQEYLTLLSQDENYSEIYGKRLIRPETCPRNGARLESCECVQDEGRKVGYTKFMKISINVTNLSINTEDFIFTKQMSGQPIGFGTSGDCYSSINCPQGRFSINLNGTGFILSSGSTWTSQGHKAAMWINKSEDGLRVFGKCGGYCGSCFPHRLTGLKLQVT